MKILVLGASRGIGLEFVRQYAQAGAQVTATARSDAGLQTIKALGAKALRLDVAGVYTEGGATTPPTREAFDSTMHTNVLGAMQTIPQVAPLVESANNGQGGKFIFITSGMGSIGETQSPFATHVPGLGAYRHGWAHCVHQRGRISACHARYHSGAERQRQRPVFSPRWA